MSAAWEMVKAGVVRAIRNPVTGGISLSAGNSEAITAAQQLSLKSSYFASISSGTAVPIAGDAATHIFGQYTIPANTITSNMHARVVAIFAKTGAISGGFAGIYIGSQLLLQAFPSGNHMRYRLEFDIFTDSTASNVIFFAQNAASMSDLAAEEWITTEAATSVTVDWTIDQIVYVKGYAQAGEIQTLLGWSMEWTK